MLARCSAVPAFMILAAAIGCGEEADQWPRAPIKGIVTLDGAPLPSGQIIFFPAGETAGPVAGAELVDGKFELKQHEGPVVGLNRVEIRSVQKTGRIVTSPVAVEGVAPLSEGQMVVEFADVVPKRYNTYSQLTTEIREGENEARFELTTVPSSQQRPRGS